LRQHPEIFLPERKEIFFFSKNEFYVQGEKYINLFYHGLKSEKAIGLSDVRLMFFSFKAERISKYNSNMKIIALLRNPIDRAYSSYWFARQNGWEKCKTFEDALKREPGRIKKKNGMQVVRAYLSQGIYHEQLKRYIDLFGYANLKIILTDELHNYAEVVISNLLEYLGVDTMNSCININYRQNVASLARIVLLQRLLTGDAWYKSIIRKYVPYKFRYVLNENILKGIKGYNLKRYIYPPMSNSLRAELKQFYDPENEKLSVLIKKDLHHWK